MHIGHRVLVERAKRTLLPVGIMTIGGGTYARNFDQFVAYGPELPNMNQNVNMKIGGPHQEDEGIQISDLMMAMAIYAESIAALAGETA